MLRWAVEEWNRRRDSNFEGMPTARCLPFDPSMIHPSCTKLFRREGCVIWQLAGDEDLLESMCNENNKFQDYVGRN